MLFYMNLEFTSSFKDNSVWKEVRLFKSKQYTIFVE